MGELPEEIKLIVVDIANRLEKEIADWAGTDEKRSEDKFRSIFGLLKTKHDVRKQMIESKIKPSEMVRMKPQDFIS